MAVARPVLSHRQARRLLLHHQGLGALPRTAQDKAALLELIERIGFVQVDSIRTLERAHHMILFARQPRYRPERLSALLEHDRCLFENWTHDASIIPSCFYPYWHHRFARERERLRKQWQKSRPRGMADIDHILATIRANGPLRARDMAARHAPRASHKRAPSTEDANLMGWGDWHPSKVALEFLWRTGELAVSRREGFQKVYDLTERVLPGQHRERTNDDVVDWAMNAALDRLGVASSGELAAFFELITPAEAKQWTKARRQGKAPDSHDEKLIEVDVESVLGSRPRRSWAREGVFERLRQLPPPPKRLRILSPFDPVLRDRTRMQHLFGFDYRIEIFVPAAKRRFGYYVFPILEGDRLIGRIDMQRDRERDALVVKSLWWEEARPASPSRMHRLNAELDRYRRFTGVANTVFTDGYLQPAP